MDYAEATYFDRAYFAHVAAWYEVQRLAAIDARLAAARRYGRPPK